MMKRLLLPCWLLLFCPLLQAAELKSEAGLLIKGTVDQVLKLLQDPALKQPGPQQDALLADIRAAIEKRIDFEEFSARAVGAKWRSFTPAQQRDFLAAFSDLLYYTYYSSLLKYSGQPIECTKEIVSSKGDKVEVQSSFYEGKAAIPINYRMLLKDGNWLLYDLHIESISIVQNYRGQFEQMLQKQSPDEVIERIRAKADETRSAADASLGR
jgi:phospholipid transport system substrate-binding protein